MVHIGDFFHEKEEWSLLLNAVSKCRGLPAKTVQANTRKQLGVWEGFGALSFGTGYMILYIYIYQHLQRGAN